MSRLEDPEEVSRVTDILSTGRYALASVRARVAGLPVPELRPPCFFNPLHGPSTRNVVWTRPGRGTRTVPAWAQDAARVANGERPDLRTVRLAGQQLPYWEAGEAFLPYSKGYFAAAMITVANQPGVAWSTHSQLPGHAHHAHPGAHHGLGGHHGGHAGGHPGGSGGDAGGAGGGGGR